MEEKKLILNEQELLDTAGGFTKAELVAIRARAAEVGFNTAVGKVIGLPVQSTKTTEFGTVVVLADGKEIALPTSAVRVDLGEEKSAYLLGANEMSADLAAWVGSQY